MGKWDRRRPLSVVWGKHILLKLSRQIIYIARRTPLSYGVRTFTINHVR